MAKKSDNPLAPFGNAIRRTWHDASQVAPLQGGRAVIILGDGRMRLCHRYCSGFFHYYDVDGGPEMDAKAHHLKMASAFIQPDSVIYWMDPIHMPVGDVSAFNKLIGGS